MAPTRIIYLIATNYILGFDQELKEETAHFVEADAAEASKTKRIQETSPVKNQYKPGDIAYIVESALVVREVLIHNISGGFYTLRFTDTNGGIKVRESRLFPTREAAESTLPQPKKIPYHPR